MKKLTAILLTLCLLLSFAGCISQEDVDKAVNDATAPLKEQIAQLNADIADKAAKIKTLENEKAALAAKKAALEEEIEEMDTELTTLNTKVAELEASGEADDQEITKLKGDISTLEEKKAALTDEKTALEASISAKDTEITTLNSSVSSLTQEKQTLSDRITALENEKTELEKENEALKNCLAGKHDYKYTVNENETHTADCLWCDDTVTENHAFNANGACACGDSVTPASTLDELKAAVEQGGKILLTESIDVSSEEVGLYVYTDLTIYLNSKTLTGNMGIFNVLRGATLTILGDGTLRVPDGSCSIGILNGTVNIAGGVIEGIVQTDSAGRNLNVSGGKIDAVHNYGTCTITGGEISNLNNHGTCTVTGGVFGFDPTEYVDTENYTVTDNGEGTWTVTGKYQTVSSYAELVAAIEQGGEFILTSDINASSELTVEKDITLHLNGKKITVPYIVVNTDAKLELFDGTLSCTAEDMPFINYGGAVSVEGCTVCSESGLAFAHMAGTTTMRNCTFEGALVAGDSSTGTVILTEDFTWNHNGRVDLRGIIGAYNAAQIICYFDPTDCIYTDINGNAWSIITDNGNGTWTVTATQPL